MMYGSWDLTCDRQNLLSFWAIFCPFIPLATQKIKILKKWRKHLQISSLHKSVPKIMIICYNCSWEVACDNVIVIYHFGLLLQNHPAKSKFKKYEKSAEDIIILHCSWDKACDGCNCYFPFGAISCHFTPLTAQKIKLQKNNNNKTMHGDTTNLHMRTRN